MIEEDRLAEWLSETAPGQYLLEVEKNFFLSHLTDLADTTVVAALSGWTCWPTQALRLGVDGGTADILCALPKLPLVAGSVQTLLLPHGLELCQQPQALLLESFRVLSPYGRLIVSGFNPYSLWRFGLPEKALGLRQNAFPLLYARQLLREAGFRLELGRFMVYVPPFAKAVTLQKWRFMELAGNRWWPAAAAVYGLVAVKTVYPLTPVRDKVRQILEEEGLSLLPGNCKQLDACTT